MRNLHDIPKEVITFDPMRDWINRWCEISTQYVGNHAVNVLHGSNGEVYINDPLGAGIRFVSNTTNWTFTTNTNSTIYDVNQ